ncbi:hypothetical protein QWY75_03430 [Pontixanthobacter aestiaquae]|uniref:Uncharacterized protein n=1 Tax=Pontixanthobacter aestiaquae TaxID=1509367 RepID=A0A844Z503_9SPHN|nr:hypothetical protein [Pontixanthobacter aestiaquae]MDN3645257.1 hypothetical protein [Pontixanthobacter aestiaquae]MXO83741.1 hypothetical protein [Pontixanthobacter aestiaquae]
MSKTIQYTLVAAVLLIVVATFFNSTFVAGGSGVVLIVGLGYAYVVSKREVERGEVPESDAV